MFFKLRMRRILRGVLHSAMPACSAAGLSAQVRASEATARARGLAWHGLCPTRAAILLAHVASAQAGLGAAASIRIRAAVGAFAVQSGHTAFERSIATYFEETARRAALERQGYPSDPPACPVALAGGAGPGHGIRATTVMVDASNRVAVATPRIHANGDTPSGR